MRSHADAEMSLYGPTGARKYLNAAERRRFIKAANRADPETRLFCLMLGWSGGRISEVLALTGAAIDIESGVANIETLKRRKRGIVRQVPLPHDTLRELNRFFKLRQMQRDPELAVDRLWAMRMPTMDFPAPVLRRTATSSLILLRCQDFKASACPAHRLLGALFKLGVLAKISAGSSGAAVAFGLESLLKSIMPTSE
jgi:integrase